MKKFIIAGAALAAFALIAFFITKYDVLFFDTVIRRWAYSIRGEFLTTILTCITYTANWQTVAGICVLALLYRKTRLCFGVPLSVFAILSTALYKLVKTFFERPRPDISLHLIDQGGYSFPSGHSMTGLVFYGLILWLCLSAHRRSATLFKNKAAINLITTLIFALIFLIGFSRIYLGVHYPTDVLAGWALGTALLMAATSVIPIFFRRH